MLRSRRLAFAAAALLVGLSACGDSSQRTVAGNSPVVIQMGGGSSGSGTEAASADKMMAPMQDITFVFDGDASTLGNAGSAWTLPAGVSPDAARIAQLAELLGVEGELRELPAEQGGGWMIGAADYSTATLTVSADGMLSWWFNPTPSPVVESTASCVATGYAADEAATTEVVGPVTTEEIVVAPPEGSYQECPQPQPPANVPDEATALSSAKQLFADMGYDNTTYEYEVYADEWGANVTAYLLLNGVRSPISLSVGYGADTSVTWASGSLATPVPAGEYPLVGVDGGVVRLNDQSGQWGGYWGGPMAMARMEGGATGSAADSVNSEIVIAAADTVVPGDVTDRATDNPADLVTGADVNAQPTMIGTTGAAPTDVVDPAAASQMVPCDSAADCGYELPPLEPVTIHLTGVTMGMTMVWAADNTVWLVPAYSFSADDGGQYIVIAVDDSFIQLPAPYPVDSVPVETVPAETVLVEPTDTVVDATRAAAEDVGKSIVGLPIDEAIAIAESARFTVRVTTLDGVAQASTADARTDRLNVSVVDGVVTGIDSIG